MPPDINEGEGGFSVSDGAIRYGLSAIKSIGQSVVDEIVRERTEHGKFRSLEDFIDRMSGREVNKRTLESFIKSGAMDGLPGTRKQKCMVCGSMVDQKLFLESRLCGLDAGSAAIQRRSIFQASDAYPPRRDRPSAQHFADQRSDSR